ncbi:MAG: YbaK/EbsC family protein [Acidobacteriota bacterium]
MTGSAGALPAAIDGVLRGLGVPYEVLPCDPDAADTARFCERYGYPLHHSANTILVASRKEPKVYAACIVLATNRLDVNRTVRQVLGGPKLSFATAEETVALTGMMLGGVTPFGLPPSVALLVDRRVMACPWVILGSGDRSAKVKAPPDLLLRLPGCRVIDGLAV